MWIACGHMYMSEAKRGRASGPLELELHVCEPPGLGAGTELGSSEQQKAF